MLVLKQERDCLSIGVMHLSLLVERGRKRVREIEKGPIYQSAAYHLSQTASVVYAWEWEPVFH